MILKRNIIKDNIISYFINGEERKAIEILYKKVLPQLKKYVISNSGDQQQAEDLFHDSLLKMIVKIRHNELDESTDAAAYLYTMARNSWVTKAKRDQKVQWTSEMTSLDRVENKESAIEVDEKANLMEEMLTTLGDTCKELLKLTFYMDYSLKEAADIMGLSGSDVAKTYQYRCKKKLFEKVKDNKAFRSLMGI